MSRKKSKVPSTIWLDFITYIFMLFYIFTLSLNLIDSVHQTNIIKIIIFTLCIMLSFFTFYNLIKRNKRAYYCMFIFFGMSMLTIIFDLINKYHIDKMIYIVEFFGVGFIGWIIPNYIYIRKRKMLFKEHNLINIKRCPGCNRIIPVSMVSCGRCGYKE